MLHTFPKQLPRSLTTNKVVIAARGKVQDNRKGIGKGLLRRNVGREVVTTDAMATYEIEKRAVGGLKKGSEAAASWMCMKRQGEGNDGSLFPSRPGSCEVPG